MFDRRLAWAVTVLSMAAAPAHAQSLGDLARQEEARRAAAKPAVKSLSNADLDPSAIIQPAAAEAAAESCYMSRRLGRCVSAEEMIAGSVVAEVTRANAPHEPQWRRDAENIRSQINRTRGSITTLEAVIANQGRSAGDRRAAEQTLAAARQSLAGLERQWEKLERSATNERVPREWLEPIAVLSPRPPQQ